MTGIERLYKLIADIDVNADPELWDILHWGTEGGWDCEKHDDKTLCSTLAAIANQIKREQGGRVSRMRVLAVVTDMERHCLGHEGMEDSPVARWARELREALGDDGRDHAADVSVSAYDLLPQEDREAIAWMRERGGLDAVKRRWECLSYYADPVPRSCMEKRLARLQRQIDESHAALRRRNQRIEELNHRASDLTRENAELRKRAMPEGMEWPRYESGELVGFGDDVSRHGVDFEANVIALYRDCSFSLNFWAYSKGERVRHPAVLASDGEPLEAGQTVWETDAEADTPMTVVEVSSDMVRCEYTWKDGKTYRPCCPPDQLTHQRPVLDADGVPIKKDEHVFGPNGGQYRVTSAHDGKVFARHVDGPSGAEVESAGGEGLYRLRADQLTHTKPEPIDTWQRIKEDATLSPEVYCHRNGIDISQKDGTEIFLADTVEPMARDLVRRCRALAERERGE